MERIFLSYHFERVGSTLANQVQQLASSHGLLVLTGERLDGGQLSQAIKDKIDSCDGLICLITERVDDLDRDWVRDERAYADGRGKRVLSIVQFGSEDGGMYGAHEQIRIDPQDPLQAFLKLSDTIGNWRRLDGRFITAKLQPNDVAALAHDPNTQIQYCLWERDSQSDWRPAVAKRTGHRETLAFLKDVPETAQVEIKLVRSGKVWESGALDQHLSVQLEARDDD